jgi:type IV pilus assembly protein PilQ
MSKFVMKSRASRFLMIIAIICMNCTTVTAQTYNEETEEETNDLLDFKQRMQKRIFIDVNEEPIEMVIRQLAEQAEMDIIKSPKVTGNVTVKLRNVPLEEALNNILAIQDCTYVMTGNVVRVITSAEMVDKPEPILSKTFEIVYRDAKKVADALDKFKSNVGSVSHIEGSNHIIVSDTESKIREISALLLKIDRVTPQVLVEVRIYDITSRDKLDLGVQWDVGRNTTIADSLGSNPTAGITDPFIKSKFSAPTTKTAATTDGILRFGLITDRLDIDAQLRAEQEITEARLLANPRILVLDNETANFNIVTQHPYVERTISEGTVTETVKFKDVGVKLQVQPKITRDGMLRLHIVPEFGVFVERVTVSSSDVPVVDTRTVDTTALIKDGQTVVLGGMRKKDVSKVNKIPLLGDLPLLGGLFRFEGEDTAVTELVVFITPRIIINQPVLTLDEQDALEETKIRRPGISRTKAEEKIEKENKE